MNIEARKNPSITDMIEYLMQPEVKRNLDGDTIRFLSGVNLKRLIRKTEDYTLGEGTRIEQMYKDLTGY